KGSALRRTYSSAGRVAGSMTKSELVRQDLETCRAPAVAEYPEGRLRSRLGEREGTHCGRPVGAPARQGVQRAHPGTAPLRSPGLPATSSLPLLEPRHPTDCGYHPHLGTPRFPRPRGQPKLKLARSSTLDLSRPSSYRVAWWRILSCPVVGRLRK